MSFLILIPLLPLLACVILTLVGRRLGEAGHKVGIVAVTSSFGLSVAAFIDVAGNGPRLVDLYRFIEAGPLVVDFGFYVDQLTVLLLLLVTGVSAIVHVYSSRYMTGDPRYGRFFAVIALFTATMVTLVMSRNLLMTYMCWEAMGICSYLLISHWAQRRAAGAAAIKAFLVNAVADVGFGAGVLVALQAFGTLDIPTILTRAASLDGQTVNLLAWVGLEWPVPTATLIVLLLFSGAAGKSAQLPFHVWLPFAMEAPTPVSALIHAATMVNAGPFLLVRFSPLLVMAPFAMAVIAVVGAATALFAALVSMTQTDIKKILAYSTISQIGFMVMTCGVGAFAAAIFHLLAHGFLKAFLFLSTGNALQALSPRHGAHPATGSEPPLPWTLWLGTLGFACLPPLILFSGPYEAMWTLHGAAAATLTFWAIALTTVFVTAVYLVGGVTTHFRQGLPFARTIVRPRLFSVPHALVAAAGALIVMAFLYGAPAGFTDFIAPAVAGAGRSTPPVGGRSPGVVWPLLPFLAAIAGWGVALVWRRRAVPAVATANRTLARLYVWFWNKLYFDEIYDAFVVAPSLRVARGLAEHVERGIVDRTLGAVVASVVLTALWLWRVLEGRGLDRAVSSTAVASLGTARWLWRVLEGRGIQGTVDRVSGQAGAVGRFLHHRELHTLQEHVLLVIGGLATLLALFYLVIRWG